MTTSVIDGSVPRVNKAPPVDFGPTGKGGGSKKGKPQGYWPYFILAVGCGICWADNAGAHNVDRRFISPRQLAARLEMLLPGIKQALPEIIGERKTAYEALLKNRFYKKEAYSGTSDRRDDPRHAPATRPKEASEHFHKEVPINHPIWDLYNMCRAGARLEPIHDWRERWEAGEWHVKTFNSRTGKHLMRDRQNWYRKSGHERPV